MTVLPGQFGNCPVVLVEGKFGVMFLAKNIHTNKLVTNKLLKKTDKLTLKSIFIEMVIGKGSKSSFTPELLSLLMFMES